MMKKFILVLTSLVILPVSSVLANSDMATIVTHMGKPSECLAPIAINKIDGEQKIVPEMGIKIEPGLHSLNGRAIIDTTFCKVVRGGNRGGYAADLEVNFEAGKTYYVGYDHSSNNRDDWKLVVWKTE